jgi:hypothetical protein
MLSTIVIAVSLCIMLLIVVRLILSVLRQHHLMHKHITQAHLPAHPLDRHVTMVLHMQDGVIIDVERPLPSPTLTLPSSWYTRHRTLVSLGLVLMLLLAFLVEGGLTGEALQHLTQGVSLLGFSQTTNVQTASQTRPLTASQRLVRLDSAARDQYHTDYQRRVWVWSSCSGFAMTEVMNAYGRHLIAADVLQEELNLGVWSVSLGLLRDTGVALTANHFGFNASLSNTRTLQNLITTSNKGAPIIVSVRDGHYFPGGHLFVIRGGDSQYVYIADSSPANFTRMTHAMFLGMWQPRSFSAVLTPH